MEKKLKNIQTFEQHTDKNLNISDVSKRLNKVHVIIESKGVDYRGSYREIVEIYANMILTILLIHTMFYRRVN